MEEELFADHAGVWRLPWEQWLLFTGVRRFAFFIKVLYGEHAGKGAMPGARKAR